MRNLTILRSSRIKSVTVAGIEFLNVNYIGFSGELSKEEKEALGKDSYCT
jgi:hypothetical protein